MKRLTWVLLLAFLFGTAHAVWAASAGKLGVPVAQNNDQGEDDDDQGEDNDDQ